QHGKAVAASDPGTDQQVGGAIGPLVQHRIRYSRRPVIQCHAAGPPTRRGQPVQPGESTVSCIESANWISSSTMRSKLAIRVSHSGGRGPSPHPGENQTTSNTEVCAVTGQMHTAGMPVGETGRMKLGKML